MQSCLLSLYAQATPTLRKTYASEIVHPSTAAGACVGSLGRFGAHRALSTKIPGKATIRRMIRLSGKRYLAMMVLCLLVAAALRLPDLTHTPPGLHYDEAANGILAAEIGLQGERPVFISSYTGKEPLFFYWAGGLARLVGSSIFSLRLTAAYIGVLTVAVTFWLGKEMLADRRQALLAAALLAVSFWHVLFSRLGFRAISEPLLQALTVAALFRGLRRDDWRWLAISGVFLGLTGYTYLAARLFPLLILLGLLPVLFGSGNWRRRWMQVLLLVGVAFLTLLPLLSYFWTHPDAFWVRIGQVAPSTTPGSPGLTIWESLLKSWGMFFLRGDPFWRFNLPGRPLFGWIAGSFLIVGWVVCLLRWRRFPYDWQRAAISILVFAPLIMILPTALATNELVPSNLRAIGLIPFLFYLPAIGFVILFADIEKRFGFPPLPAAVAIAALLTLLSGGLATAQTYLLDWAREPTLLYESDGDLVAVAEFLDQQELAGMTLYVAAPHYRHPTIAFLSENYEHVKWLPESRALVLPPDGPSLYIFPHNSPAPVWAQELLAGATIIDPGRTGYPKDAFSAYRLEEPPDLAIAQRVDADFGQAATLLGYDIEDPVTAGSDMALTLFWQVRATPEADYLPFVQLEDAWGYRWSQEEVFAYPAEQWQQGEVIVQQVRLPVPDGTPPGNYQVQVGLFDPATGKRAPRIDEDGSYAGDTVLISDVPVLAGKPPETLPMPPFVLEEVAAPGLLLSGFERGPLTTATGMPWGFALWWLASEQLEPYKIALDLIGDDGAAVTVMETQPVHDTYPFANWGMPEFVIDRQSLAVPVDLPAGNYRLHLRLVSPNEETVYSADLGPLQVEATQRLFSVPAYEREINAIFGNEIVLLGYTLAAADDGNAVLSLIWQAEQAPATDYTVFVHVLNPDGTCCVWQQDNMPQSGSYATNRWLAGEVVVDTYEIVLPSDLASGDYPIELGLYIAETGQRLQIEDAQGATADAILLDPLQIP